MTIFPAKRFIAFIKHHHFSSNFFRDINAHHSLSGRLAFRLGMW